MAKKLTEAQARENGSKVSAEYRDALARAYADLAAMSTQVATYASLLSRFIEHAGEDAARNAEAYERRRASIASHHSPSGKYVFGNDGWEEAEKW